MKSHFKVIIVGGGTAGITVAARLLRQSKAFEQDIAIFDPAEKHYYQPLWTLVGAGVAKKETTCRDMKGLIPEGAHWIRQAVFSFEPEENQITTTSGESYTYDYLVVGAGIQVNWDGVTGLKETLGKNNVCSNYSYEHVDYTWETIRNFSGGNAIFTHPNTPVKCGGAPQKIMYLAEDSFNRSGVQDQSTIIFGSANPAIFDVPKYRKALEKVVQRKQIDPHYRHNLIEVRGELKEAVFENLDTGETKTLSFDMLHVTPPMQAPAFIKESPLADENGWVDVHKYTLQHHRYPNVFGLGDSSNLPTSKTGAAIRKQAPVVVENLMAIIKGQPISARYDGYTSCPLVTGYNSLILAEFDYEKNPSESMPFNQAKERKSMYFLKKDMLPVIYWDGMLKGVL
ncbi:sulfide:quinone oxidoreductase [Bacillus pakistanensis]|uniref:Sulfide:quinone oxidoreductase n=1 Tax=Rossellomorea pakistanensis TaxID=992288 RepID=A0ABS2NDL1_9BACI|nr:FAD/NAD(P)-binding oxidoreductase [Bacillus pakistanensis]MBM7585942.1 sulfide:quinone oxidoreductase [Bacillus pakistanensis]